MNGYAVASVLLCVFVYTFISIAPASAERSLHSPLFVDLIPCMLLYVYAPDRAYLHLCFIAI